MSYTNTLLFTADLLESPRNQSEIQTFINDCLTGIVEIASRHNYKFTVEELGNYLTEQLLLSRTDSDDALTTLFTTMLSKAKVQDPNHKMFKTMSIGSLDGGLSPEVLAAIEAAKKKQS